MEKKFRLEQGVLVWGISYALHISKFVPIRDKCLTLILCTVPIYPSILVLSDIPLNMTRCLKEEKQC